MLWRFGRTAIVAPGPFSDLAGCDRAQVVVRGAGLVLELRDREIDVRRPWSPVRFRGEDLITSRLESGPVEVVNLIADRTHFKIDLRVLVKGSELHCRRGTNFLYAADGQASIVVDGEKYSLAQDHALRLDASDGIDITHVSDARLLLASICSTADSPQRPNLPAST